MTPKAEHLISELRRVHEEAGESGPVSTFALRMVETLVPQIVAESRLPEHLRGDGPCDDCGTFDNVVWFTENVLWNAVTGEMVVHEEPRSGILCIPCFVKLADEAGLRPTGWRLLAEWPWVAVARVVGL